MRPIADLLRCRLGGFGDGEGVAVGIAEGGIGPGPGVAKITESPGNSGVISYHSCTIGPARIDPLQQLGIVPDHALPYWWGGVRFLTSTGASSTGTMARCARSLAAGLNEIAREGDRPGGCSPRPWRPRSRRTLRRIYSTGTRTGVSHQGRSEHPFRTPSMLRARVIASVRSWHGRKANQPPRAVQTRDRVTGPV